MQHISGVINNVMQSIKQRHIDVSKRIDVLKRTDGAAIKDARAQLPDTCRVCSNTLTEEITITPQGKYVLSRHCASEHGMQYYNTLIERTPCE